MTENPTTQLDHTCKILNENSEIRKGLCDAEKGRLPFGKVRYLVLNNLTQVYRTILNTWWFHLVK